MMLSSQRCLLAAASQQAKKASRNVTIIRYRVAAASTNNNTGVNVEAATAATSNNKWTTKDRTTAAAIAALSLSIGFAAGRYTSPVDDNNSEHHHQVLPNGLPRTCCSDDAHGGQKEQTASAVLTEEQFNLPTKLAKIVGKENVLDGRVLDTKTVGYLKGARLGFGPALCIVTPRKLHHVQEIVQQAVDANCIVLPQGQNTGLTGGSVPHCTHDDRPTVIISMKHLDAIFPLDHGKRVVCLAGVGLASLEKFVSENFPDRESHSILGSTFLNPTTAAGVAFGSGGTQLRKGPSYTERALYLKISTNKWRENVIEVVNTLGIEGMEDKEMVPGRARKQMDSTAYRVDTWGRWIKEGYERDMRYSCQKAAQGLHASDVGYAAKLCRHDSSSVSRFNADTHGPDLNRSEGKVIILATVHDTFPKPKSTKTFWVGFDSLETALKFRKQVCLDNTADLPVSVEYMDRDAFDVVDRSGRLLGSTIKLVGTSSPIVRRLWNVKLWIEALPFAGAPQIVDKFVHMLNPIVPAILPSAIMKIGRSMDHHVAMTVGDFGDGTMNRLLDRLEKFAAENGSDKVVVHECTSPSEAKSLTAFRFVAAPAFRTWCVGEGIQGFSVDYALPKNAGTAPPLSGESDGAVIEPIKRMRYSHFGCNVVHEDLAYAPGVDIEEAKHALKAVVEDKCGGKLPAEHGHGTEYVAPKETQKRWKKMDPLNVLNPGVGGLSEKFAYKSD